MKIFPANIIKKLDSYTIEHEPIISIDLMERAATAVTNAIVSKWPASKPVIVFAGPGNNGGDALVVARLLSHRKYNVEVFLFNTKETLSPDCEINKEAVQKIENIRFHEITAQFVPPVITGNHLVLDGLFGSGLNRPLTGGFAAVVQYINSSPATVVAIDVPSGLMGEDNTYNNKTTIIKANYTFSFQFPKLSFLFPENEEFIGEWTLFDIGISPEAIEETETPFMLMEESDIKPFIKSRKKFVHKGNFGHALLIAGSYGMAGASILAGKSCIRSGVGLLTIHAPARNNDILQISVPEAMVEQDIHETFFAYPTDTDKYDAIGVGPGLGQSAETEAALLDLIHSSSSPMIVDADALNILADHRQILMSLPGGSILTPHPKELERIIGKCQNTYERIAKACQLAQAAKVHIVLKGTYSVVITPQGNCFFNPTGNPGMATGGSGDVLTGIILALAAQGYTAEEAAKAGVYVHGMAGDLAKEKYGMIGMKAGDIIKFLHTAWEHLSKK